MSKFSLAETEKNVRQLSRKALTLAAAGVIAVCLGLAGCNGQGDDEDDRDGGSTSQLEDDDRDSDDGGDDGDDD